MQLKNEFKSMLLPILLWLVAACSAGGGENPAPEPEKQPSIDLMTPQSLPPFPSNGSSQEIQFATNVEWKVQVSPSQAKSWCQVAPSSGQAGKSSFNVTTTDNDTYDERNATVTLQAGNVSRTFNITQKQKDAVLVTSNKIEVNAQGGEISIEVKKNIDFTYSIDEKAQTWIKAVSSRGLTSQTLKFSVMKNESFDKREGTIQIKSKANNETVTVYQQGTTPSLVLTQDSYTVGSEGKDITVQLKSNVDYEIQIKANWITEKAARALSEHTHHFTVAAHEGYDARTGEIVFINSQNHLSDTVKITQMQHDAIVIAQKEYNVEATQETLLFSVNSNVDFQVTTSVDWIKQSTQTRGLTEKSLSFTITKNPGYEKRSGLITLTAGALKQEITVHQNGQPGLQIIQKEYNVGSDENSITVQVKSNINYEALIGASWITEKKTRAMNNHTHTFLIAANKEYDARSTEIVFINRTLNLKDTVKVKQMPLQALLVPQKAYTVPQKGGNIKFTVQTNLKLEVSTQVDWIKENVKTRGLGAHDLSFTISANPTDTERSGIITLKAGTLQQEITVRQYGQMSSGGEIEDLPTVPWNN